MWTPPAGDRKKEDPVWKTLRGRKVGTESPLTLSELIDIAVRNNPATKKAIADAASARAQIGEAEGALLPKVTLSGKAQWDKKVAHERANNVNENTWYGKGEASYVIFDFGGRAAVITQAKQAARGANYDYNQALQDLFLDVEKAYYGLHGAQSALGAAELDVLDAETAMDASHRKFQAGLVSKLDWLQAESNYANSRYSLEEAKSDEKEARADLAEALGLPADTKFEIAPPPLEKPSDITERDVSRFIEEAIRLRPDVAALRSELDSKQAAYIEAWSDMWPSLSIGGSAGRTWTESFVTPKSSDHNYEYGAYISVDWDVFNGGSNWSKSRAAKADADSVREQLVSAELAASADVWTKYYNFKTAMQKYDFSVAFFNSARAAHELALESYNAGLQDILDLLKSMSDLSSARSRLITSREDVFVAFAELVHSTGALYIESYDASTDASTGEQQNQ